MFIQKANHRNRKIIFPKPLDEETIVVPATSGLLVQLKIYPQRPLIGVVSKQFVAILSPHACEQESTLTFAQK
jgi:hypothetical protein